MLDDLCLGRRYRWAVYAALVAATGPVLGAQTKVKSATWLTAVDGLWTAGTRWSTNPYYPDNGFPSNTQYTVTLGATGSPYTVTLDTSVTVNSLSLTSSAATLMHTSGTLTVPTLNLSAGTYSLTGGVLQGATVTGAGNFVISPDYVSAALDGVTLGSNVTINGLQSPDAGGGVDVYNGLALAGGATVSLGNAPVTFWDAKSLSGSGTLVFTGAGGGGTWTRGGIYSTSGTPLTIAAGVRIQTGGGSGLVSANSSGSVVNYGTLASDVAGQKLDVFGPLTNYGTVEASGGGALSIVGIDNRSNVNVSGGTFGIYGNWASSGTINLTNAAAEIAGNFTTASLRTLNRSGGSMVIAGTIDNTGDTIAIDSFTGAWPLAQSLQPYAGSPGVTGGVMTAVDPAAGVWIPKSSNAGKLTGVTVDTNLRVQSPLGLAGDLTIAAGRGIHLDNPIGSTAAGQLVLDAGTRLLGTGEIVFDNGPGTILAMSGGATFGPGTTLRTGTGAGSYTHVIDAPTSASVAALAFQGLVSARSPNHLIDIVGRWSNTGTFEATNSGLMYLSGNSDSLGTLRSSNGGKIYVAGLELNNVGKTTSLDAASGDLYLQPNFGGAQDLTIVTGGTLATSGGASFRARSTGWDLSYGYADAVLDGVTLAGSLAIDPNATVTVRNGLTISGGNTITFNGTSSSTSQYLTFEGTQTLGGNGQILFSSGLNSYVRPTGGTLTIGPGIIITTGAGWGAVGSNEAGTAVVNQGVMTTNNATTIKLAGTLSNSGIVQAAAYGGVQSIGASIDNSGTFAFSGGAYLSAAMGTFANEPAGSLAGTGSGTTLAVDGLANAGFVSVANYATLRLGGNWSSTAPIHVTNFATAELGGNFTTDSLQTLQLSSGNLKITGTVDNTGRTLVLDSYGGAWPLYYGGSTQTTGTIVGGTLTASGASGLNQPAPVAGYADYVSGVLDSLTIDTDIVAHANLALSNTVTLANGHTLTSASSSGYVVGLTGAAPALLGSGQVVVNSGAYLTAPTTATGTIGPGITVRTGTLGGYYTSASMFGSFLIQGRVSAETPGMSLGIGTTTDRWTSTGTLSASNGSTLNLGGTFANTGLIQALDGGTVNLAGTFTTADVAGRLSRAGSGRYTLGGTLGNSGAHLLIDDAWGSVPMTGTIRGGTVSVAGSGQIVPSGNYAAGFDGVTFDTNLTLTGYTSITNGLTLQNSTLTFAPGATGPQMFFAGAQTLGGTGTLVLAGATSALITPYNGSGLTIAPGVTVRNLTADAYVGYTGASLYNQGTITSEITSGLMTVYGVQNSGRIDVTGGGSLALSGYWTNTRTIHVGAGSALTLGGYFSAGALAGLQQDAPPGATKLTGTVDNSGNTLLLGGSQFTTLTIAGGWIAGGTLRTTGSGALLSEPSTSTTFDGLTLDADYTANGPVNLRGGTFGLAAGRTMWLTSTMGLTVDGTMSLGGAGTMVFDAPLSTLSLTSVTPTVTYGPGLTLKTGLGSFVLNGSTGATPVTYQGLISAETPGQSVTLNGFWTNSGTLQAINGATMTLSGNWSNTGTLRLDNATMNLSGPVSSAAITGIQRNGGTLAVTGLLNNGGATLNLTASTGDLRLGSGSTFSGGTLTTSGGAALALGGSATIDSVTVNGDVSVPGGATLSLRNPQPSAAGAGRILLNDATLDVYGTQALAGPAEVIFNGTANASANNKVLSSTGSLTIGPAVTVRTGVAGGTVSFDKAFVNQGTISAETPRQLIGVYRPTNYGTIRASNGAFASVFNFTNAPGGTIAGTTGGTLTLGQSSQSWTNAGSITGDAATMTLDGTWTNGGSITAGNGSTLNLRGTWTNTGTIAVADSTLAFSGSTAPSGMSSLSVQRSNVRVPFPLTIAQATPLATAGNSLTLLSGGKIDNTGGTLDLSTFSLTLTGGNLTGGTLTSPADNSRALAVGPTSSSSLTGVTMDAPVVLSSTSTIFGTLTATDTTFNRPVAVGTGARMTMAGNWSLNSSLAVGGGMLTLPAMGANDGSISLDNASLYFESFANLGTVSRTNGGLAAFYGTLANTGATFDPNNTPIGAVAFGGSAVVTGGTIASASPVQLVSGPVAKGGTAGNTKPTFDGVTLAADVVATGTATVIDQSVAGLNVIDGLTLSGSPTITLATRSGSMTARGTQTIGGTGTVVLNGSLMSVTAGALTLGPGVTVRTGTSATLGATISITTSSTPTLAGTLTNQGTIVAENPGRVLTISGGPFTNQGTLQATGGATLTLSSPSLFTNYSNGTLTGGTYRVGDNSTMLVPYNAALPITANAATIELSGPNSVMPGLPPLSTNLGSLTLNAGRTFTTQAGLTNSGSITLGTAAALKVTGSLANTGTVTLDGGTLLLDYSGASPIDAVRDDLLAGRMGTSLPNSSVAYFEASLPGLSTYGGLPADSTTLIAEATVTGDANLDGRIDVDDYALLDRSLAVSRTNPHWTDGDFNYDGVVNQNDYLLIDSTYLKAQGSFPGSLLAQRESQFGPEYVAALLVAVPEPTGGATLVCLSALGLAAGRARRRRARHA